MRLLTQDLDLLENRMAGVVSAGGTKTIISGLLNPLQLPGLQLWLDGADPLGTATAPANGTAITTWADKSGNRRNATGFNSPPYVSASRSISFNGTNQYFTLPYVQTPTVETGFVIVNFTNYTSNPEVIYGNATGSREIVAYLGLIYLFRSGVAGVISTAQPSTGIQVLISYSFNSSSSTLYLNGTLAASGAGIPGVAETLLVLGANTSGSGRNLAGTISEVLIYNQFLSAAQRQAVEGYLAWKWNLMASLPAGHPNRNAAATPASISTSFLPTYMPGVQLWLDGADPLGTGTAPANGTVISTWADKSGNARNATSVGSPVFNTSSNAIVLNGSTQGFSLSYPGVHAAETGFAVIRMTTPNSYGFFIQSAPSYARQFYNYFTTLQLGQTNIGGAGATTTSVLTADSNTVLGYTLNSTNSFFFFNGVSGATGTAFSSVPSESTLYIGYSGSAAYLGGTISEMLIYDQVLTTAQRQVVEGYLAWKWGIQGSLASNHPFRYSVPNSQSISGMTNFTYSSSYLPGLQAWYDATDPLGTGVQPANGTVISNWADKAGESLNPMIAAGSPTFTTGSQNGLPGITVAGNSGMSIPTHYQAQISPGTFSAQLDAFVVYKNTSAVTYNALISRSSASVLYNAPLDIYDTAIFAGVYPGSFAQAASSFNVYNTATSIFNVTLSQNTAASSRVTSYRNGVAATLTGTSTGWTPGDTGTHLYLGTRGDKATGFNGLFYEVMVFNAPLTTGGRQYVEGYLAWKWGLQASLPTTHPYFQAAPSIGNLSFNPSQIFGLNLWLDGADPLNTGALPANGASVSTWFDKSPNGFSAILCNSTATYNLAQRNIATTGGTYFSIPYGGRHPIESAFFVYNVTTPSLGVQAFLTGLGVNGTRAFLTYQNNVYLQTFNTQNYSYTTTGTVPAGVNGIYGYSYNSSNAVAYQNGVAASFTSAGMSPISDTTTTLFGIGGSVSEGILFNTILTTAERQVVEGYLAWKWGVQGSLAATHPYKTVQPSLLTFVPSYTNTSNIAANAASYLPLMSNTFDFGNAGQLVGSNGALSFSNVLGKNCIYINNSTANFVSVPIANATFFTVAFWFNYTSTTYFTPLSYTTPAGAMAMQFDLVSAGSITIYTALPNQWTNTPGSTNLGANTWNFIAVTVNQETFVENVYMNGALASTATGSGAFTGSPSLFVLGKSGDGTVVPSGGTRSYQGFLQNFMYFDTILAPAHIAGIYEQTALDLAVASQPTSLSLSYTNPSLSFSWVAGTNTTSYSVSFYGVATNINSGGLFLASFTTTSTSQAYTPGTYNYYYATVTPTNSGFLGTLATSSAVQGLTAPTQPVVTASSITATGFTLTWTGGNNATSYTYSGATPTTNNGVSSKTAIFTGLSNGTTYTVTVTAVNAAGSTAATAVSVTTRFPTGVLTVAGQLNVLGRAVGTGTQNTFHIPLGCSVDASGNLYISNTGKNCITKLVPPNYVGTIHSGATFAAGGAAGTSTTATFNNPVGSCIYAGFLYVCDAGTGYIRKVSLADGSVTNFSTTAGANNYITSDGAGNFFYTKQSSNAIFRITSAGVITTYATAAQTGATNTIRGIAYNPTNADIYYADERPGGGTSFIRRITTGLVQNVIDSGLTTPIGVKMSPDNTTVYYMATNNHTLKKFVIGGSASVVAGTTGTVGSTDSTTLTSARFSSPYDVGIDPSGLFAYVMDQGNQLIRRVVF